MAVPDLFNNNDQDKNHSPDADDLIENLFNKMEKEISEIELQEILENVTIEELEEKGFLGNKDIELDKPPLQKDLKNGIIIENDIKFGDMQKTDISEIDLDSIQHLPDVKPDCIIAHWLIPKVQDYSKTRMKTLLSAETYLDKANLTAKVDENKITFISKIKGKVVLLNSLPYIISCDRDGYCVISVSDDGMQALIDLFPAKGNGTVLSIDKLNTKLSESNIVYGIKNSVINTYFSDELNKDEAVNQLLIAEGLQPIDGKDAEIQFLFNTVDNMNDFKILPDGRIDYHKIANIPLVRKGDVLAKIGTPTAGVNGYNVHGEIIGANEGQLPVLIAGENVSVSKDGKVYSCECDGQVSVDGKIINVFPNYIVEGDVDFGSGNIDFNGNILIKGMILAGFEVKATGDITVLKNVESANIAAGRDLKILGGVICRNNNGKITCGRDLYASHLQNSNVEVQGDVYIGNSCVQSTVFCNGKMFLQNQKGAIIGGLTSALGGIESKNIGNDFGTKTEIIVGSDFLVQKTSTQLRNVIKVYKENIQKIDSVLLPFMNQIKNKIAIGMEKKNRLATVINKRKQIKKSIDVLEWKLKDIETRYSSDISAKIKVTDTIYSGVSIRLKNCAKKTTEPIHHVSIHYDKKNKDLEFSSY